MRKLIALLGSSLALIAGSALADDAAPAPDAAPAGDAAKPAPAAEAKPSSGGPKYGPAGCGLGSLIFSPDSGFTPIFAATTNGTSYTQTFGISSGTSNCDTGPSSSKSAKVYVETNREALAKDIARGSGETLAGLT